jgi:hypothetical protein
MSYLIDTFIIKLNCYQVVGILSNCNYLIYSVIPIELGYRKNLLTRQVNTDKQVTGTRVEEMTIHRSHLKT